MTSQHLSGHPDMTTVENLIEKQYKNWLTDVDTKTGKKFRYLFVHNDTDEYIYPTFTGQIFDTSQPFMDDPNLGYVAPSGFELPPHSYYILKLPYYVRAGKIAPRLNCKMFDKRYTYKDKSYEGLFCEQGDCPIPFDKKDPLEKYNKSKKGLLCGNIGAEPNVGIIEFTFDHITDYYDISQVDAMNISISMEPINITDTNPFSANKDDNCNPSRKGGSQTKCKTDEDFWCNLGTCNPDLDYKKCPRELRIYSNDITAKEIDPIRDDPDKLEKAMKKYYIGCNSICHAVTNAGLLFKKIEIN